MEKPVSLDDIRRRLSALKYPQLRKAAKRHSINANQKKEVLVMELSKIWDHSNESDKENASVLKEAIVHTKQNVVAMSISPKSPLNDTLNQTFTIDQGRGDDDAAVTEKVLNVPLMTTGEVQKEDRLHLSVEMASVPMVRSNTSQNMETSTCSSSSRKSKPAAAGLLTARFAAIHQKITEKQPTLHEIDANVKRRFAEHEQSVPDTFKRLATPKASKVAEPKADAKRATPGYKFKNANADPSQLNFSFSRLCAAKNSTSTVAQKNSSVIASHSKLPRPCGLRVPRVGAKELTKKGCARGVRRSPRLAELAKRSKAVTVPQLTERLQRLATPRGKDPNVSLTGSEKEALRKCGRRYIPRRGRLQPFVDTTKMTDRQFQEAKMLGRIHTLTAISASSRHEMHEQVHAKRQEARDRILQLKRGC